MEKEWKSWVLWEVKERIGERIKSNLIIFDVFTVKKFSFFKKEDALTGKLAHQWKWCAPLETPQRVSALGG